MRDLFLTIFIPLILIWSLFSPSISIIVLNWVCFQRPHDFSWGFWRTAPVFQIAIITAIISNFLGGKLNFRFPLLLIIYMFFLCCITISTLLAFNFEIAWITYKSFLPSMWITPLVMFASIHDLQHLKLVLWAFAGGVGVNAFKVGISVTATGGHLTDEIAGFVGDNNVFGLVLCLVVPILLGLQRTVPKKWWLKPLFYISLIFITLCIIYTKSRGALLSMGIILFLGSFLSKKPVRNLCILFSLIFIGYLFIPSSYFDRLSTLQDIENDVSTKGRFENWVLSWNEALAHPFFGVGPDNHILYNKSLYPEVKIRVAHSIYFQILGELGFVGLTAYLCFVILGVLILYRTWRYMVITSIEYPDLLWVRDIAFWMFCGYLGYSCGAGFLNMLYIEFPWYVIFYGSMLKPLVEKELDNRKVSSKILVANYIR